MLSPKLFSEIEEFLSLEFGGGDKYVTVLEGEINFLNDWLHKNRFIAGSLFSFLAAWNTRNTFFL
jgi:hypothetical protein